MRDFRILMLGAVLAFGIFAALGCGSSEEEQAPDSYNKALDSLPPAPKEPSPAEEGGGRRGKPTG